MKWTTTPPSKPGWYWWRKSCMFPPSPVSLKILNRADGLGGEWYPIPIPEPEEE